VAEEESKVYMFSEKSEVREEKSEVCVVGVIGSRWGQSSD